MAQQGPVKGSNFLERKKIDGQEQKLGAAADFLSIRGDAICQADKELENRSKAMASKDPPANLPHTQAALLSR